MSAAASARRQNDRDTIKRTLLDVKKAMTDPAVKTFDEDAAFNRLQVASLTKLGKRTQLTTISGRSTVASRTDGSITLSDRIGMLPHQLSQLVSQGWTPLLSAAHCETGGAPKVGDVVIMEVNAVTVASGPAPLNMTRAVGASLHASSSTPVTTMLEVSFFCTSQSPTVNHGSMLLAVAGCTVSPDARAALGGAPSLMSLGGFIYDPSVSGIDIESWQPFLERESANCALLTTVASE